jgi:hypothetical protein
MAFKLWSERYDRELKDIFDVQDEIAKAIAERLRVPLPVAKTIGWSNRRRRISRPISSI